MSDHDMFKFVYNLFVSIQYWTPQLNRTRNFFNGYTITLIKNYDGNLGLGHPRMGSSESSVLEYYANFNEW